MSVEIPDRVCTALGCHESDQLVAIDHPDHGRRVVCETHAREFPVIEAL